MRKSDDDAHLLIGRLEGNVYRRNNKSESYVTIPPALVITDSDGAVWSLGTQYVQRGNVFEWNILRNDVDIDEMASHIEYRNGVVRIFGVDGWRTWGRARKVFI